MITIKIACRTSCLRVLNLTLNPNRNLRRY